MTVVTPVVKPVVKPVSQIQLAPGSTVTIPNVSWEEFEAILQELGEKRSARIAYSQNTYDHGKLTIYLLNNRTYGKSDHSPTFPDIALMQIIPTAVERAWQMGNIQALEELEAAVRSG